VGKPGPKKIHRYSVEFKLTAVKLSQMPRVEVQTVADALDIHPFMLSRWRKDVRDRVLRGRARRVDLPARSARELKQLQTLKREHALLQEEHVRHWPRSPSPARGAARNAAPHARNARRCIIRSPDPPAAAATAGS
jgi:transposase